MNIIINILRMLISPWGKISFKWGARRLKKWAKKNKKEGDESKFPFSRRYEYIVKKLNVASKRMGITVTTQGKEYLPKGSYIMVINDSPKFIVPIMYRALGTERMSTFIREDGKKNKSFKGYSKGGNGFILPSDEPISRMTKYNAAASWCKSNNRSLMTFPQLGGNSEEYKIDELPFKMAQKFFLPIVPVSVVNLEKARFTTLKTVNVKVIFHKPIKPMKVLNLETSRVSKMMMTKVNKELN